MKWSHQRGVLRKIGSVLKQRLISEWPEIPVGYNIKCIKQIPGGTGIRDSIWIGFVINMKISESPSVSIFYKARHNVAL